MDYAVKKFVYWLMGDRAGRLVVGTWNWLWGRPVESGGKVAVAVAEESLASMQESVHKLAKAVAMQVGSYERAQSKYQQKIEELKTYEQQARFAQRAGHDDGARRGEEEREPLVISMGAHVPISLPPTPASPPQEASAEGHELAHHKPHPRGDHFTPLA